MEKPYGRALGRAVSLLSQITKLHFWIFATVLGKLKKIIIQNLPQIMSDFSQLFHQS